MDYFDFKLTKSNIKKAKADRKKYDKYIKDQGEETVVKTFFGMFGYGIQHDLKGGITKFLTGNDIRFMNGWSYREEDQ